MQYLEIVGGKPLCGEISVQGSKNAALPILTASLLGEGPCVIENCPRIQDVEDTLAILRMLGCRVRREGTDVSVDGSGAERFSVFGEEAERIRSSVLFLGALLGKMGEAQIAYPGGCSIGRRPIDLHRKALEALGASFSEKAGSERTENIVSAKVGSDRPAGVISEKSGSPGPVGVISARAPSLQGGYIALSMPSVGATENAILAAVLARGETMIDGAAREPEIDALCEFLNLRGAEIERKKDGRIHIRGQRTLGPVRYRLCADRIVAGNYLMAAAACGGHVRIRNLPVKQLGALTVVLTRMGVEIREDGTVETAATIQGVEYVKTAPYPGFPTDLQSPLMALLSTARGKSTICETIFEDRFRTAGELRRMGADIQTEGSLARIVGVPHLHGARVQSFDLRGGAALTAAALAARGRTRIDGYAYIARGYEDICRDFMSLGADIHLRGHKE